MKNEVNKSPLLSDEAIEILAHPDISKPRLIGWMGFNSCNGTNATEQDIINHLNSVYGKSDTVMQEMLGDFISKHKLFC